MIKNKILNIEVIFKTYLKTLKSNFHTEINFSIFSYSKIQEYLVKWDNFKSTSQLKDYSKKI